MTAWLLLVGLVLPLLGGAPDQAKSSLKEFVSKKGGFSVLLPDTPKEEKVPIRDPNDKSAVQYQFATDRGNGAYVVSYQDNPKLERADDEAADRALRKAQSGAQATLSPGKLLSEKKIKLEGKHPGREFEVEVPKGPGLYRSRIYLVKGRLYQVIAVGVKEFATTAEADKVLGSFKLSK